MAEDPQKKPQNLQPAAAEAQKAPVKPKNTLSGFATLLFGFYLVALALGLGAAMILIIGSMSNPPTELDFILVTITAGAIGSFVHAATSFASYVGNQRMAKSWMWWYILRPFIGSSLALIFYFIIRAGFIQTGSGTDSLSIFGIGALAGLTGMFSKQATDKLRELFDNLFKVADANGADQRLDKLTDNKAP